MNFNEFVKGKRIVIVGPADSIKNSGQGELIELYDLVVRVNISIPVTSNRYNDEGKRTDIFYTCLNPESPTDRSVWDPNIIKNSGAKVVVFPLPLINPFLYDYIKYGAAINAVVPLRTVETEWFEKVQKEVGGSRPTTGFLTILDLLRFDIKELYITGFTFFKTGYMDNYKRDPKWLENTIKGGYHNFNNDLELMKKIYKNDSKIKVDGILEDILNN